MVKRPDKVSLGSPPNLLAFLFVAMVVIFLMGFGVLVQLGKHKSSARGQEVAATTAPASVGMIDTKGPFIALFVSGTGVRTNTSIADLDTFEDCRSVREQMTLLSDIKVICLAKKVRAPKP